MRRRLYLAGCVGLAGALAGCTGILGGSDDSESDDGGESGPSGDGPAATIEALYDAFLDGNAETARSYYHPDAQTSPPRAEDVQEVPEGTLRLEGTTVVEQGSDEATVEATISEELSSGERGTGTRVFVLRKHDGDWKIYDRPQAGTRPPPVPQVHWETTARTDDGGAVTAVEFQHAGGDDVDVGTLRAAIDQTVATPEGSGSLAVADSVVATFTAGEEGYDAGSTVSLRWTPPNVDVTRTLAQHELESGTSGRLDATARIE